ncbi:MAG TPA: type II secretion system F family protein [Oscillospiraceae bacterium]|nr:type II secretion system F family protein [Oscillospiraceae bacterium]
MNSHKKSTEFQPLVASDISLFCSQTALILKAAIPMQDGMAAIQENVESAQGKQLLKEIENSIAENGSLYTALLKTGAFPSYMVNMVNIGEKSGKLDNVMEALALYYDREDTLKKRVKSAVLYPFILILMMAAVIAILVIKVLPIFNQVFQDLGSDVSASSAAVLNVGIAIGKYAFWVILVLAVLVVISILFTKTRKGAQVFTDLLSSFAVTRKLSGKIAAARFASVMSMLISSGYDTSEALDLVPKVLNNKTVIGKVEKCKEGIRTGSSFAQAVTDVHMFPGIYSSMIHIGAKTGNLDTVMEKLAALYDEDVDTSINNAVSVIEPVMVGVLSVVIGSILLSVMLPLMGIMSSIG